jgi:hypothetical protein
MMAKASLLMMAEPLVVAEQVRISRRAHECFPGAPGGCYHRAQSVC